MNFYSLFRAAESRFNNISLRGVWNLLGYILFLSSTLRRLQGVHQSSERPDGSQISSCNMSHYSGPEVSWKRSGPIHNQPDYQRNPTPHSPDEDTVSGIISV
ncbi:hypothetical protein AMECASPLE_020940 [Ameca splendens]|uniref:Uncharacterized protein n=1 Tax=Ameca splendens TaxID=208324 RepID=A0ABV0YEH4_9TELE